MGNDTPRLEEEHRLLLAGSNRRAHEMALPGHPALRESAPPLRWDLAGGRAHSQPGPARGSCLLSVIPGPRSASPARPAAPEAVTEAIPATAYVG